MTIHDDDLGGRLRLRNPADLPAAQKQIYDRLNTGMIQWAETIPFRSTTSGGRLIGPYNPMLLSPNTTSGFLDFIESAAGSTTLDARLREVVILTIGAVWKSDYEIYAHSAVARKAGLPEQAIRELVACGCPEELTDQDKTAHRYARQLTVEHRVDNALYRMAEQAFGSQGLVDLAYLLGWYYTVCALLNAFEVPVPEDRDAATTNPPTNLNACTD
jgi:4-carboxymuconolactone decarboxylase